MSALPHVSLCVDALLDADRIGLHRLFAADTTIGRELERVLADSSVVIDMLATTGDVKRRLESLTGGAIITLIPAPAHGCASHIIEQWRARLPPTFATDATCSEPLIATDAPDRAASRTVILHPGSGGRAKCWPLARFTELADQLRLDALDPAFMLGPTELEWHGDAWPRALATNAPVIVEDDLRLVARRMAAAVLYVGNDAGSTHLAAAVGTPTVAIFGPTDPCVWRPIGERVHVVTPPKGSRDIKQVSIERVLRACRELFGRG